MSLRLRLAHRLLLSALPLCLGLPLSGCGRQAVTATVNATWVLVAGTEPDPATAKVRPCADFGATTVRIEVTPGSAYDFPCTDYHGATMAMPAGYYSVQVITFGTFGKVLATLEFPETYAYGQTNLGELRIPVR